MGKVVQKTWQTFVEDTYARSPIIRSGIASAAIATRETLTVDGGAYYIDTTVPHDMQEKEVFNQQGRQLGIRPSSYNVFEPNETYTVFFLYLTEKLP